MKLKVLYFNETYLHKAIENNNIELIEILLKNDSLNIDKHYIFFLINFI